MADLSEDPGLCVSHLMREHGTRGGDEAARDLSHLHLDCADFSPVSYNGPELLAVGGETGVWLWEVSEWAYCREGKRAACCYTSLTCNRIQQCKWSQDGTMLVAAMYNHRVEILCTRDWSSLRTLNCDHVAVQTSIEANTFQFQIHRDHRQAQRPSKQAEQYAHGCG
eukprot:jgi/Tetstr1/450253/TSEL_037291.t1